ncbi:hypothetical protein [Microvirga sp. P5_D2]
MARLEIHQIPKSLDAVRLIAGGELVVPVGASSTMILDTTVGIVSAVPPTTDLAKSGDCIRLNADKADIHLFHPQTGQCLAA